MNKEKDITDLGIIAKSVFIIAMASTAVPSSVKDYVMEGAWDSHVAEEADSLCRSSFSNASGVSVQGDGAGQVKECYEQPKNRELNVQREMSSRDYISGACALMLATLGVFGVCASGMSFVKRRKLKSPTIVS